MVFKIFLIILLFNLTMSFYNIDFNYPFKLRLNNGNYLVIASEGIYMYNPTLTSKINVLILILQLYMNIRNLIQQILSNFQVKIKDI